LGTLGIHGDFKKSGVLLKMIEKAASKNDQMVWKGNNITYQPKSGVASGRCC